MQFQHSVTQATRYYYRVRANNCSGTPGTYSDPVSIVVQPVPVVTGRSGDVVTPLGSTAPVSMSVPLAVHTGKTALDNSFTASVDKPYLSVTPSSGTLPATVTVTGNPASLPPGANTGTLHVTSNGTTSSIPVSISLTTPVAPNAKTTPPANALIIPAAGHLQGEFGPFQTDVRLANGGSQTITYQISYTPTQTDGTTSGKSTTVSVDPGQTVALNDIANDFFGIGASGDTGFGSLEVRPLNTSATSNYASSRTFTFNAKGTYGQFLAALPFSSFATKAQVIPIPGTPPPSGTPSLSFQQVAASSNFYTNLGLIEGSGSPASGTIRIFNDSGTLVSSVPYSLLAGEHKQVNHFLEANGADGLTDGRIEVTVDSQTGAVSGYASVVDKVTNDPFAVMPVQVANVNAAKYIIPGMAALVSSTNFHSDVRLFNGGTSAVTVTPMLYPFSGSPIPATAFTVNPGEVKSFNDIVSGLFQQPVTNGVGGSVVFSTGGPSSLVVTGRTYTIDSSGGTFGQFIPGVTASNGIGTGDRPLQILQLEQSANFRSNVGLTELTWIHAVAG